MISKVYLEGNREMKKYIKYAFSRTLPVLFGYIFLGIAFGIVLQQAGFNFIWAFCISLFLYAGSMQFVLVPLLASAASPLPVAVTTLFVNSRHVFYGLSFIESFKKMKTQLYMIFSLSDETYSVLCSCKNEDPEEKNRSAWFLINLFDQSYWITGSVIGALLGQVLPFDFTGIDFSMTALFVVILLDQVLRRYRASGRHYLSVHFRLRQFPAAGTDHHRFICHSLCTGRKKKGAAVMNTGHSILLIAIASGITFLIRAFPFLVFKKRQMPAFLKEIADKLPPAIIAVLVIYCLKGPLTVLDTETIAAAIAIAGVVILHLWKRNTLLSVAAGTVLYMIFIRCLP